MIRYASWMLCLIAAGFAHAQDLVIANARIIDGTGRVIERGSIAVRAGVIESVGIAPPPTGASARVDAAGMTVMPGFIDTHRHVIGGGRIDSDDALTDWLDNRAPMVMRDFLEAGFTTVLSAGDLTTGIVELKRRVNDGRIAGPRLFVSGDRIRKPQSAQELQSCLADAFCKANRSLVTNADEARAKVRELVAAGVDVVKIRLDSADPNSIEAETLAAIADEAKRRGVPSIVHATEVNDMIAAVKAGTTRLVHTPHTGTLAGTDGAKIVVDAGVPVSSTLGVWVPLFGEANDLRWRNGAPFPPPGVARAGQGPVNARYLWDAGVPIAYGTDTGFSASESLAHELRPLRLLFSGQDIVAMLTRNAANWLDMTDMIGTLESGHLGDIVIVDGDPLSDISDLANIWMVVKDGRIVVDNR